MSDWIIYFEDAEMSPEVIALEWVARERHKALLDNWNCHLFRRVDSDAEQLLRDAIDDLPDPSQGTGPFSPTALQVIRVKDARKKLWGGK